MAASHRITVLRARLATRFHRGEWDQLVALEAAQAPPARASLLSPPAVLEIAEATAITPSAEHTGETHRRRQRASEEDRS